MPSAASVRRIQPSLWALLWATPFFLIGVGVLAYTVVHGMAHMMDSLTQVVVPGHTELSLQHGRQYDVFLEEQSVVNGKIYSTNGSIDGLVCHVNSIRKGTPVTLERPTTRTNYAIGGRSGHSVLKFVVKEDGRYDFGCAYGEQAIGPTVVVAVGTGVGASILHVVFVSLLGGFGGFGGGAVVIIVVMLKREREKKTLRQSGQLPWSN